MGYFRSCVWFLFMLCLFSPITGQSSIPTKQDGFWYGDKKADAGRVFIEAFFDPVCPDSRDSWPPLKEALKQYGSRVSLSVHTFPLPYHDNAFATSRALHIVDELNSSATYPLLEAFFQNQEQFYNKATFNLSRATVTDRIVKFSVKAIGNSYHSAIVSGFNDTTTDHATRVGFKFGCLRGVYGTPYFFVNGFPLLDSGSALNYSGWRKVLDPLLGKNEAFGSYQEVMDALPNPHFDKILSLVGLRFSRSITGVATTAGSPTYIPPRCQPSSMGQSGASQSHTIRPFESSFPNMGQASGWGRGRGGRRKSNRISQQNFEGRGRGHNTRTPRCCRGPGNHYSQQNSGWLHSRKTELTLSRVKHSPLHNALW